VSDEQKNTNGADGMMGNNPAMNGMQGQMGFGFPNQGGFNNGMAWNGMPNMMANSGWNGMNPMGMSLRQPHLFCKRLTSIQTSTA
jgi:hypothetical protein